MDIFERIKSEVSIEELLTRMWIKYNNKKSIYEDWKFSDSYNFCINKNIVTNHNPAKEYRAVWNPLNFYIQKTWSEIKEALNYFEKEFWILQDKQEVLKPIEPIHVVTDIQRLVSYLYLRWIEYWRLPEWFVQLIKGKVYWNNAPKWEVLCMQCPMFNDKFVNVWFQSRSLIWKWFNTNGNDWYFLNFDSNIHNEYLFIVEWMSDFLSLRQYTQQVIWFKSSSTPLSDWMISFLSKFTKIYLLFDNDAAWQKAKDKFKESIDANIYELEEQEDINELTKDFRDEIIESIKASAIKTQHKAFQHISYKEWLDMWMEELLNRTKDSVMSYWFDKFDNNLWFILPWQLIVVWWITWVWKSTLVNQIANNVARQWFMVCRYSLEDRLQENRINDLYYQVCYLRGNRWSSIPEHHLFEANMCSEQDYPWITQDIKQAAHNLTNFNKNILDLFHSKMLWILELEKLFKDVVINRKVKLVVIDHLHYVKFDKMDRHDLAIENFMHQLNDLLRKYNVACILVSHYKKLQKDEEPDNNSFKDWAAIAQVANKVIHINKDKHETNIEEWWSKSVQYIITKNRGKSWTWVIMWRFENGRILLAESQLAKERRLAKRSWF